MAGRNPPLGPQESFVKIPSIGYLIHSEVDRARLSASLTFGTLQAIIEKLTADPLRAAAFRR